MKKVNQLMFFLLMLLSIQEVAAQNVKVPKPSYKTGVGLKFFPLGITVKSMTTKKTAIEFLGYFHDGFRVTGLYEYHGIINEEKNLKWYIGGGGHIGFADNDNGSDAKLGVDGIIGLDYKFLHLPLNISLDWQPSFGLGDESSFTGNWGGIGARFCF